MSVKVAITIPIYKVELSENEKISFSQALNIFRNRDIIIICPDGLDVTNYRIIADKENKIITYESFDEFFFKDINGYNSLMLSHLFYDRFVEYEYILIYQLDCFVFKDELDVWVKKGYDYVGAPWLHNDRREWWTLKNSIKYKLKAFYRRYTNKPISISMGYYKVGNGGFSLRNVKKFSETIRKFENSNRILPYRDPNNNYLYAEDVFWGCEVNRYFPNLRIPSYKQALGFAFDMNPSLCYELNNNQLPFGCHAWYRYESDFWKSHIEQNIASTN